MSYLIATNIQHCSEHMTVPIEYVKHPTANVLAILKEGNYLLANISPPSLEAFCYLHSRGDVITASVQQVYELIQAEGIAWCEL